MTLVGPSGLEPPTSRLSVACSSQLSYKPIFAFAIGIVPLVTTLINRPTCFQLSLRLNGGDEGNRTPDPLLAGQVLSQLSYTPVWLGLIFLLFERSGFTLC